VTRESRKLLHDNKNAIVWIGGYRGAASHLPAAGDFVIVTSVQLDGYHLAVRHND